jgi:hypothetical protein
MVSASLFFWGSILLKLILSSSSFCFLFLLQAVLQHNHSIVRFPTIGHIQSGLGQGRAHIQYSLDIRLAAVVLQGEARHSGRVPSFGDGTAVARRANPVRLSAFYFL